MVILQFDFYITARFKPMRVISPGLKYRDFLENYYLVVIPSDKTKGTLSRKNRKSNLYIIVNRKRIP